MTKGTPSMGKKSGKMNFMMCRRCGRVTYHVKDRKCSSCGFGKTAKMRSYSWQRKKNGVTKRTSTRKRYSIKGA